MVVVVDVVMIVVVVILVVIMVVVVVVIALVVFLLVMNVIVGMSERETFRARLREEVVSGIKTCPKSVYSMQKHTIL